MKNKFSSKNQTLIKNAFKYVNPFEITLIIVIAFVLFNTFFDIINVFFQQKFIDSTVRIEKTAFLKLIYLGVTFVFFSIIILYAGVLIKSFFIKKLEMDVNNNIFRDFNKKRYNEIEKFHSGDLILRITQNANSYISLISLILFELFGNILLFIISFVYLSRLEFLLSLLILVSGILTLLTSRFCEKKIKNYLTKINNENAQINENTQEIVQNIEIIKSFKCENFILKNNFKLREKLNKNLNNKMFWITVLGNSILAINDGILLIATFSICVLSLWRGVYIGVLFAFINLIGKVQWPFIGFSDIVANISKDIVGISRVNEILTCSDEALDNNPKKEFQIEHNAIEFEDVSYSYAENDNTINSINFKIKAGEKIGIAGISGSGKSTIAKLCSGLYEPSKGNIYVCGKKIKDNLHEIRNEISYVNQSPYLFCTTINENIKLGNTSCDQEQVIEAAKKAGVHDFIENLENKYETILSEKGNNLSGGQKQKISLARNFLKNSKIFIFDEITASLDFESEKSILSILLNNSDHDSTIIFISHSSFVLEKLGKVIFINNGSVSDIGRHQDLIKTNKNYKIVFS